MAGADSPKLPPDKIHLPTAQTPENLSDASLADSPILLFVCFHKAIRSELVDLRRIVVAAAVSGFYDRDLVPELLRRFEFLKLVYKYHCAAEDEVIFLALDSHVKNVACTYSLEHESIDDLFVSLFGWFNVATEANENAWSSFRELVLIIGTIQTSICQHMLKEEQQVFPLMILQFSFEEQASLVWEFICSVPITLLEEFLPWMISFFPPEERMEVVGCLKKVAPKTESLQEVLVSWLSRYDQSLQCSNRSIIETDVGQGQHPVTGLHLWHSAIRNDLQEILEELCQIKISCSSSHLKLVVVRLNFIADVLIFYRNALEKFFYPVLSETFGHQSHHDQRFVVESRIQSLQQLLFQSGLSMGKFVEKLCWELESFILAISRQFAKQETEIFPIIMKNCSSQRQQQLLSKSLTVLPLGLLKCVIIWFSTHLPEDESRTILQTISQEDIFVNKSFTSLLLEWLRVGYSGKTSVESFRKDLRHMFKRKCQFSVVGLKKGKKSEFQSLSYASDRVKKYETPYSSGINLHISFPEILKSSHPFPEFVDNKTHLGTFSELIPMDLIFFCHKALKKDLDYLVLGATQLSENAGFLVEFHKRFHLIQFLFHIHSDAEDEIAFPALEAKGEIQNISHSYSIDHEQEVELFNRISSILQDMSEVDILVSKSELNYQQLCVDLLDICKSMHVLLSAHLRREEMELWPLFRKCFSIKEQEKIIGRMLGRIKAEILQDMIPWLMESLIPEEQTAMLSLWLQATKNTMFDEWLAEWWDGYSRAATVANDTNVPPPTADPLEIIYKYLSEEEQRGIVIDKEAEPSHTDLVVANVEPLGKFSLDDCIGDETCHGCIKCIEVSAGDDKKRRTEVADTICQIDNTSHLFQVNQNLGKFERLMNISQVDLEAVIRRVSRDTSLDSKRRSYLMQNLLMSRWIVGQKISNSIASAVFSNGKEIPGHHPSYRDPDKLVYGCKHYKRNCKLYTPCCNQLFSCIRCHDEVADHLVDRKTITQMMCMKCLVLQPVGPTCSTISCDNFLMGKYYCRICKLFDDDREIYHCPYCNLCRIGKGLGIDLFHCMSCNACMKWSLSEHICREKCLEENCPICHEYIFTSSNPVKALPCGHLMHSTCFKDYTCSHYVCPICSKSLGDMQVYFRMLDALLAEEKIPDDYSSQVQIILCNDCEKKGNARFHWLYHKCSHCGSYNTRLL